MAKKLTRPQRIKAVESGDLKARRIAGKNGEVSTKKVSPPPAKKYK